ncbi:MAG: LacI family DNA-binding transcriptional regulator [Clostridia bacterium]|nr:LacI family DNA-binding transcriptional regulator [Clostridia bacterium]
MNIYDVSNKAGVSIATVSRVLNGNSRVSDKTRDKVLNAMKELDYTPNVFARGLGLNTMKTIGIMCIDSSDIYLANAVYYLEQELRKYNYDSILCCTGKDYNNKKSYLELLMSKRVDGIILAGSQFVENTEAYTNDYIINAAREIPIVLVNGYLDAPNIYSVMCNDEDAVYKATKLLINNNHRNIVYLYTSTSYSGVNKYHGYLKAMKEACISLPDDYHHLCGKNISHARDYLVSLHEKGFRFDAVMTSDDSLAAGAVKYAHTHNIRIPEDMEVIGYNNSVISLCTEPELTSIDSKVEELSSCAVSVLMKVLSGEDADNLSVIAADIIKRNTTIF